MKELVSPEQADEWVKTYHYGNEHMASVMRPIRRPHVGFLAREMALGKFQDHATIEFAKCIENDRWYIVNGNHTLRAIMMVGKPVMVTVEHVECQTMDDVRTRYATYDVNLARKRADSLRAYNAGEVLDGLSQKQVQWLSGAVAMIVDGLAQTGNKYSAVTSPDILLDHMKEWAEPFHALLNIIGGSSWAQRRIFGRKPVLAVALITMRYQRPMAAKFWEAVATGESLKANTPALVLRNRLYETTMVGGLSGAGLKGEDMAKLVAHCWNKEYEVKKIERLAVPYDKPISIAGAPPIVALKPPTLEELQAVAA